MKDSTKEYLMAGGSFAWALVSKFASPGANTARTSYSASKHWDKAQSLRFEEEHAAEVPIGTEFLLPSERFKDKNGKFLPGGRWKTTSIDGRYIILEHHSGLSNRFLWSDIEEYRQK